MLRISRKALPGLMVVLALLLGAWTMPGNSGSGSNDGNNESHANVPSKVEASQVVSSKGSLKLSGNLANVQGAQERVDTINSFKMDFAGVTKSNVTELDKQAVEDGLTSNSLELWTMEYAYGKVKDSDLRNLISMMLVMHSQDQKTLIQLANQLGVDTSVDFTNASVYPETPDYDLGMRTENLKQDYLDHLVEKNGSSFDETALSILDQEHTSDIQGELTQERMITNPALKAFAKHSADVTELHLSLIDVVDAKISVKTDEPPSVDFQKGYMSPFMITVNGKSNSGQSQ